MKYLQDYWDLLSYRILSEARAENRQLYIGFSWWILEPLAYITVLYLVFGVDPTDNYWGVYVQGELIFTSDRAGGLKIYKHVP